MIRMKMGGKIRGDILMWNFKCGEIHLRARPKVHDELVAIAEFDQPGAICLGAPHERSAGPDCNDAHLVSREQLGVRKVMVACAIHRWTKISLEDKPGRLAGYRFGKARSAG